MPERQVAKNLQLDETTGPSTAHMELQETGRQVDSRWQLRNEPGLSDWQPVEYARPSQSEPNWILPSLVGLVLIGVAGYMVYIGLNRLSNLDIASVPVDPAPVAEGNAVTGADAAAPVVSAVEQEATETAAPTAEPTETAVPTKEPTAEPTVVLVEQEIATIANQFGVNARLEPSTTSEVLRILEEGETVVILDEQASDEIDGNWLQVRTSEDATVWISSQFVDIETQVVPGEPRSAASVVPEVDVRVTISSPAGLNARAEPDSGSEIVALLPDDTSYSALSQSADGQWIEVAVDDSSTAWIFLQLVIPDNDLASLPVFQDEAVTVTPSDDEAATDDETTIDETAADETADDETADEATAEDSEATDEAAADETADDETATDETVADEAPTDETTDATADETDASSTETITETVADEPDDSATGGAQDVTGEVVTIANQFGVNARTTTSTDGEILQVLETGSTPSLRGRNEDGSWLQVVLDDGILAWVFAQAVEAPENIEGIPVYTPPAVGEPAETLDDAAPADAQEATEETATDEETDEAVAEEDASSEAAAEEDAADAEPESDDSGADDATDEAAADASLTATVSTFLGAKARPAPTTEQEEIDTVPFNEVLDLLGRSEDGEWVQVELFEDQTAWILVTKVDLSVPIEDLTVTE